MIALEPGQQWLSQFRLLEELVPAADNRPSVWLAEKHGGSSRVVLKFLRGGPPSAPLVRRLADWRATRVARFMPLLAVHTAGEQIVLELPYLPQDNAALRGAAYAKWSAWLEQVAGTLRELHREHFIHGDLKLGNIRCDAGGRPVLSDPWLPGDGRSPHTSSPERLRGASISPQDDLYALGAQMHELATGYPPGYPGISGERPAAATVDMPHEARRLMQALLDADPAKRPALEEVISRLVPLNTTDPQVEPCASPASAHAPAATPAPAPVIRPAAVMPAVRPLRAAPAGGPIDDGEPPRTVIMTAPAAPRPTPRVVPAPVLPDPTIILRSSPPPALLVAETPFEPVPIAVEAPEWKQPASPGVNSGSPFQSRASVWRWPLLISLLAGAIAAFVWLPDEMRQSALEQVAAVASHAGLVQAPAAPKGSAPAVPNPDALRLLAGQKLSAEQVRDRAQSLEGRLRDHGAAARSIPAFLAGGESLHQGLAAFDRHEFAAARTDFESALQSFQSVEQVLPDLHRRALADGDAALAQCLPAQALNEYRYALALNPGDAAARVGIERAQVCEQVFAHVSAGARAEQGGDVAAARREYGAALKLDPGSAAAHDALTQLDRRLDDTQFSRQLAAALEGLRAGRYSAAATALAAAEKLHPDSADVQRLNAQLSEVRAGEKLQALKAEAAQDERAERWSEALDAYRAMLAVDGTLALGAEGARRSQDRMQLDAELAGYIEHPERLAAQEVRQAADAALAQARILRERGPRIETQISRLGVLLSQYESTVQVSLRSDGITDVTIYRVGTLGRFGQRSVSLRPGKYTIIGSRLGYRDVRREIEVVPGEKDVVLDIRCEEQI